MKTRANTKSQVFNKQYNVAIGTVPLPEEPEKRVKAVVDHIMPIINEIVTDAITVAIGTWPTPEKQ